MGGNALTEIGQNYWVKLRGYANYGRLWLDEDGPEFTTSCVPLSTADETGKIRVLIHGAVFLIQQDAIIGKIELPGERAWETCR